MRKKRNDSVRIIRVNVKAVGAIMVLATALVLGVVVLHLYQERRMDAAAVAEASRLHESGDNDLALRALNQHLTRRPTDLVALALKAEILGETADAPVQILEAARVYEQCLRVGPNAENSQAVRRKLVGLYVRYGDTLRTIATTQFVNQLVTLESRYRAAETIARQLIARGATDAGAYRLLAMALDGLAVPGDPQAIDGAVQEYRRVLAMDPSDVEAAERLSRLYLGRLKDPIRAERVLDDLLRAEPKSSAVRLARHRFYLAVRGDERYIQVRGNPETRAAAELEAALAIDPNNIDVLVSAAEHALRRGGVEEARRQLARVAEADQKDIRVLMVRGMIDFSDERPDEAVDTWRHGLSVSSGTNEQMTWWLGYALLQMGRVSEARPLIAQYRRLSGQDTPQLLVLQAQLDERTGRPTRAATLLGAVSKRLDPQWEGMIQLARGRCYEALWDEHKAMESYNLAMQADPTSVVPRLAIAKLKLRHDPNDAISDLERGLTLIPGDPALRVALAGALLRREAALPRESRDWRRFEAAWKSASEVARGSSAVVLMWADRLALAGRASEALAYLGEVASKSPRNAAVVVALADGLNRLGQPAKALEVIERALAPDAAGDQASLRIARAKALVALNRGRDARTALIRDVDKLAPVDRPLVWVALGQLELARGNPDTARLAYAEWSRLQPEDPRPRLVLLELALQEGNEGAVRGLVEELRALGGDEDAAYRLGRAKQRLAERDAARPPEGSRDALLEEAGRLVDAVLSEAPELPAALLLKAQVLDRMGRAGEAITAYEKAWSRGIGSALPRLVELLTRTKRYDTLARIKATAARATGEFSLLSAQAFLRNGEQSQARGIAEQITRDAPDSAEAASWQARMLNHLGQADDAEAVLLALAERQPGRLEPWLDLIRAQAARRNTDAVARTVKRVRAEVRVEPVELVEARCLWAAGDTAAADRAFAAALARKPNDLEVRAEAARFYEQNSRPAEAEACLKALLAIAPKDRGAIRQLATVLASRSAAEPGLWDQAWAALGPEPRNAVDEAPEDRLARALVLSRSPDAARRAQAVERLDTLTADLPANHPTAGPARELLARLLLAVGQADRASKVAAVSANLAANPDSIALYAQALLQSKKADAAEWQLDRLAALNPGDSREAGLRVRLFWDGNRPVESAAAVERAYSVREGTPGADALGREAFLLLAESGRSNDAARRLGLKLAQKSPTASWMPARILARTSRFEEAIALLMTAAGSGAGVEDLRETCRTAMEIAVATDDPETLRKVDAVLSACRRAEPTADDMTVMLAMLRHIQRDFEGEVQLYRGLLTHRAESFLVLNNLAWALSEGLGKPEEALELANALVKPASTDIQALDTRGIILARLGRFDEALHDLETVVRSEPTPQHHFHLARAYKLAGRTEDARRTFDLARQGGLTPREVDPAERDVLVEMMKASGGPSPTGPTAAVTKPR